MNLLAALKTLQTIGMPIIQTVEAACKLGLTNAHASQVLRRLALQKHIVHLSRGLWAVNPQVHPFLVPEYFTAPFPAYVSLQTALYHLDMINQIPRIITVVSLGRTRRIVTPLATISVHQIAPEWFFGYDYDVQTGVKMASPEKALLDIFYLRPAKSLWFRSLPEVELPENFDRKKAFAMIKKIPSPARQTVVKDAFREFLDKHPV